MALARTASKEHFLVKTCQCLQAAVYFASDVFGLGTTMPSCMRVTAMSTKVSFTGVSCSPSSCAACHIHASQQCITQTANIRHHISHTTARACWTSQATSLSWPTTCYCAQRCRARTIAQAIKCLCKAAILEPPKASLPMQVHDIIPRHMHAYQS